MITDQKILKEKERCNKLLSKATRNDLIEELKSRESIGCVLVTGDDGAIIRTKNISVPVISGKFRSTYIFVIEEN